MNIPNRKPHIPVVSSRREFLTQAGAGFGSLALTVLLAEEAMAQQKAPAARRNLPPELKPRAAMLPAKAKSVIFIFMNGGPSHVDTFDYKPGLAAMEGKTLEGDRRLMRSPFAFPRSGKSGLPISEIFPDLATCADELCLIHSLSSKTGNHGPAVLEMHTGDIRPGHPAMGSWITYGLGTENQDLPAFMVLMDGGGPNGGAVNWANGFMPSVFQGTVLRSEGQPLPDLQPARRKLVKAYRSNLQFLNELNAEHAHNNPDDAELEARITSYEMAYRMQSQVPKVTNLAQETAETNALYGIDKEETKNFGRRCLMARRLVENGVRFVQIYGGGGWDAHDNIAQNHRRNAREIDRPIAGLIKDLKRRGLLESTLIVWAGEFGRTPTSQNNGGRDHHPQAHTVWMAGGGVKGGRRVAHSDELGNKPSGTSYGVHDLHKTILRAVGLDDMSLTYLHNGRYQRLTDTGGKLIEGVL